MPAPTPTATDSSTGHRRPGRPRCDELDDRLVEAVLELLHDGADVTVNAVVRASGVSRATLYRRWRGIDDLVAAALDHGRVHPEIPLDGDLRANIEHALFDTLHPSLDSYPETRLRERLRLVMADRALQRTYWSAHVTRRRESLAAALHAGVERGLLRRDLDVEATIDLLNGVFYYQYVVRGVSATRPDALARCRAAFDTVWRGIERED